MRITIINGIEGFHNVFLEVNSWFCIQNRIAHKEANVIAQTEKAILVETKEGQYWIPKSLYTVHEISEGLNNWLSIERGK